MLLGHKYFDLWATKTLWHIVNIRRHIVVAQFKLLGVKKNIYGPISLSIATTSFFVAQIIVMQHNKIKICGPTNYKNPAKIFSSLHIPKFCIV